MGDVLQKQVNSFSSRCRVIVDFHVWHLDPRKISVSVLLRAKEGKTAVGRGALLDFRAREKEREQLARGRQHARSDQAV